ncbi:MAG: GTPase domain-containing protein, partial [Deltaproteobacteria bacterium]
MALINYANKEINAKIVYYGPGLSGKTTNIQYIFQKLKPEHRGKLITLPTQTDRTLFFDFLPVEIPDVKGFKTRFHLYTVPGQVFYNATRKMVLKGVDGIVFVADSQREKLDDNVASLKNLEENLSEYGKTIKKLPFVFQFNKRDLRDISDVKEMVDRLNQEGYPYFEAIAT